MAKSAKRGARKPRPSTPAELRKGRALVRGLNRSLASMRTALENEVLAKTAEQSHADLPTTRLLALLEELGREMRGERGWKKQAAELLGVHPSYVSRVLAGDPDLRVGRDVIAKAGERLRVHPDFFYTADAAGRSYKAYLTPGYRPSMRRIETVAGWSRAELEAKYVRTHAEAAAGVAPSARRDDLLHSARRLLKAAHELPIARAAMLLEAILSAYTDPRFRDDVRDAQVPAGDLEQIEHRMQELADAILGEAATRV